MGLTPVAPGDVATVVTTLEMRAPPPRRALPASPLRLERWTSTDPGKYRTLFRRVGARWLWYSRLVMEDARLVAKLGDPSTAIHVAVDRGGAEVAMFELHRVADACELAYFALVPELTGKGHGRWLMAEAMTRAWLLGVKRVWVNTCTLDHPSALGFYQRQGFVATARTLETFPDPRALGLLPADAAPQIPYLADTSRR